MGVTRTFLKTGRKVTLQQNQDLVTSAGQLLIGKDGGLSIGINLPHVTHSLQFTGVVQLVPDFYLYETHSARVCSLKFSTVLIPRTDF
jgi:hypothetical protein